VLPGAELDSSGGQGRRRHMNTKPHIICSTHIWGPAIFRADEAMQGEEQSGVKCYTSPLESDPASALHAGSLL